MGKKEKLLTRIHTRPTDFRWAEAKTLLNGYGFLELQGDGSKVKFYNKEHKCIIRFHKPHGKDPIKKYVLRIIIDGLKGIGIEP